jgi:hypothetical protein
MFVCFRFHFFSPLFFVENYLVGYARESGHIGALGFGQNFLCVLFARDGLLGVAM